MSNSYDWNKMEQDTQELFQRLDEIEKQAKENARKARLQPYISRGWIEPCLKCGKFDCSCHNN